MSAGLLVAAVIVIAMAALAVLLVGRGEAEPAARAAGRAPDPREEREASEGEAPRGGVLAEPDGVGSPADLDERGPA
jgi:hypothetical protein